MKAVVIGNINPKIDNISAAQLHPFFAYRKRLLHELGLEFKHIKASTFADIKKVCESLSVDIIFIRPDWREDTSQAEDALRFIREKNVHSKIIFLDPFDQTSSRYFGVLPYVDQFLKYQRLKDVSQYRRSFAGGSYLTDYLANQLNYDLDGWHVGSEVPEGYEHRIGTYWHPGLAKWLKDALFNPRSRRLTKDIDIFCRLSFKSAQKLEWYGQYRLASVRSLLPFSSRYKLAVDFDPETAHLVSRQQYFSEIRRSRIVFSPFGWGEVTWRDYEAICYGCLLIKPSVEHVDTKPNIFYPGETYVPVRWDLEDLEEKCQYYLDHPYKALQIIENAYRAYTAFFEQGEFVRTIRRIITAPDPSVSVNSTQSTLERV